jgi:hypothetical protein
LRKCRRLLKDDHWKSERHLFVQWWYVFRLQCKILTCSFRATIMVQF